jgi:hypothetical protein
MFAFHSSVYSLCVRDLCDYSTVLMKNSYSGVSADATLCMQRDGQGWGVYSSLPSAIASLRNICAHQDSGPSSTATLTLRAYFAESDALIGRGGQKYFEECWREGDAEGEGKVRFGAKIVEGSDHDSIVLTEKGVVGDVFREVKRLYG